jgi:hypothetical protein
VGVVGVFLELKNKKNLKLLIKDFDDKNLKY